MLSTETTTYGVSRSQQCGALWDIGETERVGSTDAEEVLLQTQRVHREGIASPTNTHHRYNKHDNHHSPTPENFEARALSYRVGLDCCLASATERQCQYSLQQPSHRVASAASYLEVLGNLLVVLERLARALPSLSAVVVVVDARRFPFPLSLVRRRSVLFRCLCDKRSATVQQSGRHDTACSSTTAGEWVNDLR